MSTGAHIDDKAAREGLERIQREILPELRDAGAAVMTYISGKSTRMFMRNAGKGAGPRSKSDTGPLRIVTGRLARSVRGGFKGGDREGIHVIELTDRGLHLEIGSNVEYAAAHEYGNSGQATVPASMVRAHTRTIGPMVVNVSSHARRGYVRQMNVPARPYLSPALDESMGYVMKKTGTMLQDLIRRNLAS